MAKRKRKSKKAGSASKLRPAKNYRSERYVPYIFRTETGILEAWTIEPDLTDGDVRGALRSLIRILEQTNRLPAALRSGRDQEPQERELSSLMESRTLDGLRRAFDEYGPLSVEDTIGILSTIDRSVGSWSRGMRGQEYLNYIRDFLGQMGVTVRQLSPEEAEEIGLTVYDEAYDYAYDDNDDDNDNDNDNDYDEDDGGDEPPAKRKNFLGLF